MLKYIEQPGPICLSSMSEIPFALSIFIPFPGCRCKNLGEVAPRPIKWLQLSNPKVQLWIAHQLGELLRSEPKKAP